MNEEMNTIENETTENTTELDEREELRNELESLEDEPKEEQDNMKFVEGLTKLGVGFAAGYAAGRLHGNVKQKRKDEGLSTKEHFWNRIHFQSPFKIDKKKENPVKESKDDSKETKNPENTQTPGTDQEKK